MEYKFKFLSGPADQFVWVPYWVDAGFIEELRPKEIRNKKQDIQGKKSKAAIREKGLFLYILFSS